MIESSKSDETNAGICPKTDKTKDLSYVPETPVPANKKFWWCGEEGKICTFPFYYLSELYYDPYIDDSGVAKCGTLDNSFEPIVYSDAFGINQLESAFPCSGE